MTKEKCCGSFPEFVCGDCPHANPEQVAQGGISYVFIGTGTRCTGCFETRERHSGTDLKCPPPNPPAPPAPPPPPQPMQQIQSVSSAVINVPRCPSCKKKWDGRRGARQIEGVICGTCWQPQYYE